VYKRVYKREYKRQLRVNIIREQGVYGNSTCNDVNNKLITESDLEKYKTILETTNAHLEVFEPGNDILIVRGPKFIKVISKLFPQTKRSVHWGRINER